MTAMLSRVWRDRSLRSLPLWALAAGVNTKVANMLKP